MVLEIRSVLEGCSGFALAGTSPAPPCRACHVRSSPRLVAKFRDGRGMARLTGSTRVTNAALRGGVEAYDGYRARSISVTYTMLGSDAARGLPRLALLHAG